MPRPLDHRGADDLNTISRFLAYAQILSLNESAAVDVLVLCGNAIPPIADIVFTNLEKRLDLATTLVICGGVGHSTKFLYSTLRSNRQYSDLADQAQGLPEADVYELILRKRYPKLAQHIDSGGLKLIVENKSTNCGDNAIQTRRVLEVNKVATIKSCIIVQDPTMSLRTVAAFQHAYRDVTPSPEFFACPTFVPKTYMDEAAGPRIGAEVSDPSTSIDSHALWNSQRFFGLVMGEIPRPRDDENGYGPRGKNFIVHVDIPKEAEAAWARLNEYLDFER